MPEIHFSSVDLRPKYLMHWSRDILQKLKNGSPKIACAILLLLAGCYTKQLWPSIDQTQFATMRIGAIEFDFPSSGKELTYGYEKLHDKTRATGSILVFRHVGGSIGSIGNTYAFVYVGNSNCDPGSIGPPVFRSFERPPNLKAKGTVRSISACFDRNQELEIIIRSEPWPGQGGEIVSTYGDAVFKRISQSIKVTRNSEAQ